MIKGKTLKKNNKKKKRGDVLKIVKTHYRAKKRRLMLFVEHDHEKHGLCTTEVQVKLRGGIEIISTNTYVNDEYIPTEEHVELMKEMQNNQELRDFVLHNIENYFEDEEEIQSLTVEKVFVLRTDTKYIREVARMGPNLSQILERQNEQHSLILAVKFQEIEEEVRIKLTYNRFYEIEVMSKYKHLIENYQRYDWEERVKEQVLPMVKEKVNFYLP